MLTAKNKILDSSSITDLFDMAGFDKIQDSFSGFEKFMMMYSCAIKEVTTKFEVLNADFSVAYNRNPIEMIKSRVKKPKSIFEKLQRKDLPLSMDSVLDNLNDVAGVRVICSFIDDIYEVAQRFSNQDDIRVIEIKDYIKTPKENGYRSYHMIIEIPVFFADTKRNMRVEIQFRTIAMDFWASLEHKMKYKKSVCNASELEKELKECAEIIAQTDIRMQSISNKLSQSTEI